jgi:myo-inositol-1(or 4)-monophosphatase
VKRALFEAAAAAERILRARYGRVPVSSVIRKGRNDFVSLADRASERAILSVIRRRHPGHAVLTEERGELPAASDFRWIVDPLDGTTNYLRGHPRFAISLAVERKGILVAALVRDVMAGETFFAEKGRGAFVNGRRIRVSRVRDLKEALVLFGSPFRDERTVGAFSRVFAKVQAACADHRREGCASLDLAAVASGRAEAFYEIGLKPWDMAGGSLLVAEAGGWVGDFYGENENLVRRTLLAVTPCLKKSFLSFFRGTRFRGNRQSAGPMV